jgi:5'-3' exonuclease
MGIPGYFREIKDNYKDTLFWDDNFICHYLFLDFNNIIYDAVSQFLSQNSNKLKKLSEKKIFSSIIQKVMENTKNICTKVLKPKKLLYISIDGPAPRAKMIEQRERRYKKIIEENLKEKIIGNVESFFNTSNITPGTKFMMQLNNSFVDNIEAGFFGYDFDIILSNSNIPGEAEHKINPYIEFLDKTVNNTNENYVIFGQDADLLVLYSNRFPNKNIYVMRPVGKEIPLTKNEEELYKKGYIIVDVNKYQDAVLNTFVIPKLENKKINKDRLNYDYEFLTFLGKNDFVRELPFLEIRADKDRIIITEYAKVLNQLNDNLILNNGKKIDINENFLKELLKNISLKENQIWQNKKRRILTFQKRELSNSNIIPSPWDEFQHKFFFNKTSEYYSQFIDEFQQVYGTDNYDEFKKNYYNFFTPNIKLDDICYEYLKSLKFTLLYYLKELPSWEYYYPFLIGPFASDLYEYLNNPKNKNVISKIKFEKSKPFTPFEQLLMVLPKELGHLLPKQLNKDMNNPKSLIGQYYPDEYTLEILKGEKFIYTTVHLKKIDEEKIREVVKMNESKFTKDEKERNKVNFEPIYFNLK